MHGRMFTAATPASTHPSKISLDTAKCPWGESQGTRLPLAENHHCFRSQKFDGRECSVSSWKLQRPEPHRYRFVSETSQSM